MYKQTNENKNLQSFIAKMSAIITGIPPHILIKNKTIPELKFNSSQKL